MECRSSFTEVIGDIKTDLEVLIKASTGVLNNTKIKELFKVYYNFLLK